MDAAKHSVITIENAKIKKRDLKFCKGRMVFQNEKVELAEHERQRFCIRKNRFVTE